MQGIRRASYDAAVEAVKRELRAYPTFRVTDIRIKDDGAVRRELEEDVVNSVKRA